MIRAAVSSIALACVAQVSAITNTAVGQTQRDATPEQVFHVGDRVVVFVQGEPTLSDTFTVREGVVLKLPTLPDIKLDGVARDAIQPRVAQAVAELYRNREVRASTLVRIGVLGQVVRAGYYELSVDASLSDALMLAGGPSPAANPDRIVVRRAGATLLTAQRVRDVMATGATVSDMGLRSGDDILVQDRQAHDWSTVAQVAGTVSTLLLSILYAVRR